MLFSALPFRPAYFVIGAAALALAACGGASSDEAADSADAETIDESATGAFAEMTRGEADAIVTVIEYASVTCPHCATFHEQVYPTIKENYIDTGKVRFVFREFPTAPANLSIAGSMLARCAADDGGMDAYFLVLDTLFKTQRTWIYGENPREELIKIAAQAGMSADGLDACIAREELLDFLNESVTVGRDKYDIRSTPSFVVNGTVRHFSSVEDMSAALDEAIEKAGE
ncbi:MAG: DsbA family protein [Alphaproteobacteria bacterium]|nr:DsbA family protein [Alphaproteobacteria bacterium]